MASHHDVEVYLGLGSNLAHPQQQLRDALHAIAALPETQLIKCSPFYQSKPMGPVSQDDFINAVAKIITTLPALTLLDALQAIEAQQGRKRLVRWGPRTLDLDILLYGQEIINQPRLSVPHRGLGERNFVLYPLADVADMSLLIPGQGCLNDLLAKVSDAGLTRLDNG